MSVRMRAFALPELIVIDISAWLAEAEAEERQRADWPYGVPDGLRWQVRELLRELPYRLSPAAWRQVGAPLGRDLP